MRRPFLFVSLAATLLGSASPLASQEAGLGRHKQLYAVPPPGAVAIDGKLDDWDLSGQIRMFVTDDTADIQGAQFALMYDQEALYISGVVKDQTPMLNRQDPRVSGDQGWNADSCQFRITLDPERAYPDTENVFDFRSGKKKEDTRDDIKHLTLWYYTDREEPVLQIKTGMKYRNVPASWAPHGVVPSDQFTASYRKNEDGKGYTFEYRIPWATLGQKAGLKGEDQVAGTVQFNWGNATGLRTAGGSAWAYDVMSKPGFVFQSVDCWGKIHFAPKGNISRELVEAGVPQPPPTPLEFEYELPKDGEITLQLFDEKNTVHRTLLAKVIRTEGAHREKWDGMNDQGKPLPPGRYTLKGIIHEPIREEFLFSLHNSGQPPYPTDDGRGGWGADHGSPRATLTLPNGDRLLSWSNSEYGWGTIRVDSEGNKQWGASNGALLLAGEGERFYTYSGNQGFYRTPDIQMFDTQDGRPLSFGNGKASLPAPGEGTPETKTVSGLAAGGGRLYASYGKRNLLATFNGTSGELLNTRTLEAPGPLAWNAKAGLIGVSAGRLVKIPTTGDETPTPLGDDRLEAVSGLALGPDGTIFVAHQGALNDISVYSPQGKLQRRIGHKGGRPAFGDYIAQGLYRPEGISVDEQGALWVAEAADAPKRISVWDVETGQLRREFFGGSAYFAYANLDPQRPSEVYAHNTIWTVDWDQKASTPLATIWRATEPGMVPEPTVDAYPNVFRVFTAANGKQYGWGEARATNGFPRDTFVIYRREENLFKPFLALFRHDKKHRFEVAELDDDAKVPTGNLIWQDANNDQRMQPEEILPVGDLGNKRMKAAIRAITPQMEVLLGGGQLLKPTRFTPSGQPIYDLAKAQPLFGEAPFPSAWAQYQWFDPDAKALYTFSPGSSLTRWNLENGQPQWSYPHITRWHDALGMPIVRAGNLWGMTGQLGVAGRVTGNMSYFGVVHLFERESGIYVTNLMRDGRTPGLGPDIGQPEGQGGRLVRFIHNGKPRTVLMAAGQDARVTEVHGLETIERLPDTEFTLAESETTLAATARAEWEATQAGTGALEIAAGREALAQFPLVSRNVDPLRRFGIRLAYDQEHLYVEYEVTSPTELLSSVVEPNLLFKGGNALDLQIATDAAAPAGRKTPAPGDLRLLITQRKVEGKKEPQPYAVVFRPKVAGFQGEATVLSSPTGSESFDEIAELPGVTLEYRKTPNGFTALAMVPLKALGLKLEKGKTVLMDAGYLFGNNTGSQIAARKYLHNASFTANVTNDIPHESRLEPAQWAEVPVN